MSVRFQHHPHPRILERRRTSPPKATDERIGLNNRIGLTLTAIVGTMWCAYAFAFLALLVLPEALGGGVLTLVGWLSQTFIQLVMLSVIMVGQNILGRAADRRSEMTYSDADAAFHETQQVQAHLAAQDQVIDEMAATIERLHALLVQAWPAAQSSPVPDGGEAGPSLA